MTKFASSHPPMSEILVSLMEASEAEGSRAREPERCRDILLFTAAAWNASRLDGPDEWRTHLRKLFNDRSRAEEVEQELGKDTFDALSARARREWPSDSRQVTDVRVVRRDDGSLQVYALSRPETQSAAEGKGGGRGLDPLEEARDLLVRTNLPPRVEAAVEEILDRLLDVRQGESSDVAHLSQAGELVVIHAVTHPEQIARARKPEVWAAGALHAASLTTFLGYADPERLTTEQAARLFDVSTASVSNRSTALRDSWDLALEAGAHPRFPGAPAGMVRLASATPTSDGTIFDLDRFVEEHGLQTADRNALRAAAERAVKAYYREVLGKDPEGRFRWAVLDRPSAFGRLVREVLRQGGASEEARDALALRAVAPLTRGSGDPPDLVLLAVARLGARGQLAGSALVDAATRALRTRGALDGIRREELRPLWRAVVSDPAVGPARSMDVLASLVRSAGASRSSRRGAELVSDLARDPALPEELRKGVLERIVDVGRPASPSGKTTPGVRRRAYRHLAEMAEEPAEEAVRLAKEGQEADDFDRWRAAAEVVEEHGSSLPEERVRQLVRDGLGARDAAVRQAWYRTGMKVVGGDVAEWAPDGVVRRAESRKRRRERGRGGDPTQTSLF